MRPLDSVHDLSKGEREYLGEQGVSSDAFDKMSAEEQQDWKREMQNPAYEDMRNWEGSSRQSDWEAHRRDKHNSRNK